MAAAKKKTITKPGSKPVTFTPGGLHKSTGTPAGQKIPAAKVASAAAGKMGPLAKKQAAMAVGFLAAGRKTAAGNRSAKKKGK